MTMKASVARQKKMVGVVQASSRVLCIKNFFLTRAKVTRAGKSSPTLPRPYYTHFTVLTDALVFSHIRY